MSFLLLGEPCHKQPKGVGNLNGYRFGSWISFDVQVVPEPLASHRLIQEHVMQMSVSFCEGVTCLLGPAFEPSALNVGRFGG